MEKIRIKYAIKVIVILMMISLISISCNKSKDLISSSASGVVIDAKTMDPIPFAKVNLVSNTSMFFTGDELESWDVIESLTTDDEGNFHFDFTINDEVSRVGVHVNKDHYFDYKEVHHYGLGELRNGIQPSLFPKAYLQIRIKDEAPYSDYRSMHIPTLVSQNTIEISGSPIDTVVTKWLRGDESDNLLWFYHDTNGEWIEDGTIISACNSFDTCYYEIIF